MNDFFFFFFFTFAWPPWPRHPHLRFLSGSLLLFHLAVWEENKQIKMNVTMTGELFYLLEAPLTLMCLCLRKCNKCFNVFSLFIKKYISLGLEAAPSQRRKNARFNPKRIQLRGGRAPFSKEKSM